MAHAYVPPPRPNTAIQQRANAGALWFCIGCVLVLAVVLVAGFIVPGAV